MNATATNGHMTHIDPATGDPKTQEVVILDKEVRNGVTTAFLVRKQDGTEMWTSPETITHQFPAPAEDFRFEGKTAAEWRAEAARSEQSAHDSFERCDTDGFLSQWASQQMATRYLALARATENGGRIQYTAFIDLTTGEMIRGRWRETQHGSGYAPATGGKWIFPSNAKSEAVRERNNAKKGVRQITVWAPAELDHKSYYLEPDLDADPALWVEITE